MVHHDSNWKRIYALYMTPNKNGKDIFETRSEKIDEHQQVPPTKPTQHIEFPHFCSPTKISEKILKAGKGGRGRKLWVFKST